MMAWESEFSERMRSFTASTSGSGGMSVSLKVRVTSGCFHREHSPRAYAIIDQQLEVSPRGFELVEHESGPELLTWIGSGLSVAAGVITVVVAIIGARRAGVQGGDAPSDPLEVIVRRMDDGNTFREEKIAVIPHGDAVDPRQIKALLDAGVASLAGRPGDVDR